MLKTLGKGKAWALGAWSKKRQLEFENQRASQCLGGRWGRKMANALHDANTSKRKKAMAYLEHLLGRAAVLDELARGVARVPPVIDRRHRGRVLWPKRS